jgi:hypothetical protein
MERGEATPFHIAWITGDDKLSDTVGIVVYDSVEYRVPVFEADTGLPTETDPRAIADRAAELLRTDGGFVVHSMEPHGSGYAAVVEATST